MIEESGFMDMTCRVITSAAFITIPLVAQDNQSESAQLPWMSQGGLLKPQSLRE
jgi:hypothetical protein